MITYFCQFDRTLDPTTSTYSDNLLATNIDTKSNFGKISHSLTTQQISTEKPISLSTLNSKTNHKPTNKLTTFLGIIPSTNYNITNNFRDFILTNFTLNRQKRSTQKSKRTFTIQKFNSTLKFSNNFPTTKFPILKIHNKNYSTTILTKMYTLKSPKDFKKVSSHQYFSISNCFFFLLLLFINMFFFYFSICES